MIPTKLLTYYYKIPTIIGHKPLVQDMKYKTCMVSVSFIYTVENSFPMITKNLST